jgi:hypothetical protein
VLLAVADSVVFVRPLHPTPTDGDVQVLDIIDLIPVLGNTEIDAGEFR